MIFLNQEGMCCHAKGCKRYAQSLLLQTLIFWHIMQGQRDGIMTFRRQDRAICACHRHYSCYCRPCLGQCTNKEKQSAYCEKIPTQIQTDTAFLYAYYKSCISLVTPYLCVYLYLDKQTSIFQNIHTCTYTFSQSYQ